jgi:hypothetical protein
MATLDVSGFAGATQAALLRVVTANSGALHELRCVGAGGAFMLPSLFVVFMLQAAPLLTVLHASSDGSIDDATRMLRGTVPFQPLRLTAVRAFAWPGEGAAECVALGAALAGHASLQDVGVFNAPLGTAAALDAIVDAALGGRCPLSSSTTPISAPRLRRRWRASWAALRSQS